jgi:Icc-related predicted phosphoesterase
MAFAERAMADYRVIRWRDTGMLSADDTRAIHQLQAAWLARELAHPWDGASVVVTHHLPHPGSIHPRYEGDPLNPGFASDLSALVRDPVKLWIHGHTHESMDYLVEGTRVVCNPRGYLPQEPNSAFDASLVVQIGA